MRQRIYGELVSLLAERGDLQTALAIEAVGHELAHTLGIPLPAIVIATPEHCDAIKQSLAAHYFDVPRLEAANDLIIVDAADTLARFMVDGMPDAVRFRDSMIPMMELACRGRTECVIRAYGEMVDLLWQDNQTAAAIRLEMLWNQLAQTHAFALLCGYSMGHFYKGVGQHQVRQQHTHLVSDSGDRVTLH